MEGWTIVAVTQVDGTFDGCDHDKKINLANQWVLTCGEYNYSYAYRPDVVVFAKPMAYAGRQMWMVKVLIEDEFYDMRPITAKQR